MSRNLWSYINKLNIYIFLIIIIHPNTCISQQWVSMGSGLTNNGILTFTKDSNLLYTGGGFYSTVNNLDNIAVYNGSNWNSVGTGMLGNISTSVMYDGNLHVGGYFANIPMTNFTEKVAKWNGSTWTNLNYGVTSGDVNCSVVFNGEYYIGGNFSSVDNLAINDIAKWDGVNWSPVCTLSLGLTEIHSMTVFNNELIVAGYFWSINGIPISNIAKFDGNSWSTLGSGIVGEAYTLFADDSNNRLYVGGNITSVNNLVDPCPSNIAYWDGISWHSVGNGPSLYPRCIYVFNNELYAGLDTKKINSFGDTLNYICKWDGNEWMPLGEGLSGAALTMIDYNNMLVVGGTFISAGTISANFVAGWQDTLSNVPEVIHNKCGFSIYPNPSNSLLYIQLDCLEQFESKEIHILDLQGRIILHENIDYNNHCLNLSTLDDGVYQITIFNKIKYLGNKKFLLLRN